MPGTYQRIKLSASTNGRPIKVAATAIGSGTPIHTVGSSGLDEINLNVTNTDSAAHTLTIGWGGFADPDDLICKAVSIPPNSGPWPIVADQILQGALTIYAAADTTNVLLITGGVNRIL